MLDPIIDSYDESYYAVFPDLSYKEVASLEKTGRLRPKPLFLLPG